MNIGSFFKTRTNKREWSKGISNTVVKAIDKLEKNNRLGTSLDLGAGEGRHSLYGYKRGFKNVIAVEIDKEQVILMREKFEEIPLINIVEQDALLYLRQQSEPVDCIIDNGFSHCVTNTEARSELFKLIYDNLKPSEFYVITHFSEKETLSKEHFQTNLDNLKNNFPKNKWREVLPWAEVTWKRNDGKIHYAYTAILERKLP